MAVVHCPRSCALGPLCAGAIKSVRIGASLDERKFSVFSFPRTDISGTREGESHDLQSRTRTLNLRWIQELRFGDSNKLTVRTLAASHHFALLSQYCNSLCDKELSMINSKKMQGRLGRFRAFWAFVPSILPRGLLPHHARKDNARIQKLSRFSRPVARFLILLSCRISNQTDRHHQAHTHPQPKRV